MSKEKRALPDEETKRKFREALERKSKGGGVDVSDHSEHGKVDHAHGLAHVGQRPAPQIPAITLSTQPVASLTSQWCTNFYFIDTQ